MNEVIPAHSATPLALAARTLVVEAPNAQALIDTVAADMEIVPLTTIDSDELAEEITAAVGRLSTVASTLDEQRLERGAPLRDALKWLNDGYNPAIDAVKASIQAGKNGLLAWSRNKAEKERIARAEAEAKARAEAEARAREAAAAAAKAQAEAVAAAQQAQATADTLRAAGDEEAAAVVEAQAVAAVDTARHDVSAAVATAFAAPARVGPAGGGRLKGTSETWKAECIDKAKLLIHIADRLREGDKSLMNLVEIDVKSINALAKLQKEHLSIPGLRPYTEGRIAVRKQTVEPTPA